jgi:hypothetical protein
MTAIVQWALHTVTGARNFRNFKTGAFKKLVPAPEKLVPAFKI